MSSGSGGALGNLDLCLEFTDTVDYRDSSHPKERLWRYGDLVAWSQSKGITDEKESGRLLRLPKDEAATAENVLREAKALREAIYNIFSASAQGKKARQEDVNVLNEYLARAMAQMEIQMTESGYRLGWCTEELADKMLYPIAKSAAELLTSEDLGRVRKCDNKGDGCGSLFIDNSKSHSRRWCSMESCGNKVKLRTYYQRHKQKARRAPTS
jgi:predicted RNA-binding Zn ribbon-like protein